MSKRKPTLNLLKHNLKQSRLKPLAQETLFVRHPNKHSYSISPDYVHKNARSVPNGPEGDLDLEDGGSIGYIPQFFQNTDALFRSLREEVCWERKKISLFGKMVEQPRRICYMADDPSLVYTYSRSTMQPLPYTPSVLEIKSKVENFLDASFNCVLLNLYQDGRDHMGWHSDNEPLFGKEPLIASVSFGAPRAFDVRKNGDSKIRFRYMLGDGDLLVMKGGAVQKHWKHAIMQNKKLQGARINLTFRSIEDPESNLGQQTRQSV